MLFTASTVKDSAAGLREFVARNLAGGVDHMFLFVDDFDAAITAELNAHPHVTAIATGPTWWHAKRPRQLNARQRINANVAKVVLAPFPWAEWLFHIDGDECLQLDRSALADLPPEVGNVRAAPLEAVSRKKWPGRRVTHFKRMLETEELTLLQVLGLVDEPLNGHYFHGHCEGKSGLRPRMDRWLTLHDVHDAAQQLVPAGDAGKGEFARLLHYESWSGEEFVRKWVNILGSGAKVSFRPAREPTAVALRALVDRDLPEKKLRAYLMRIFERTTEDDFETLLDLGLLEEIDPLAGGHRPEALGAERRAQLDAVLAAVMPENKWPFHTGRTAAALAAGLERVVGRLDDSLAPTVRDGWKMPADLVAGGAGAGDGSEDSELEETPA
jgi:hypothetical protein